MSAERALEPAKEVKPAVFVADVKTRKEGKVNLADLSLHHHTQQVIY